MTTPTPRIGGSGRSAGGATLRQVADAAGVSRSTAARTLGNYGMVDPELQAKVLAAAETLGYRRNALARSVSSGRSNTIGVVVSDIEDPHFARAMRGISDVAGRQGFDVILANTDEKIEAEHAAVKVFLDKRVDGFIVTPSSGMVSTHLTDILQMPRPLVLIDRFLPGLACDWVGADDYASTHAVIGRLVAQGHRRIDLVVATTRAAAEIEQGTAQPISPIARRIQALRDASASMGVKYRLHTGAMSRDRTRQVVSAALDLPDPPTALLASYSEIALTAFQELRRRRMAVPEQVSLVSLDDAQWMTVSTPAISAVERPSYAMGVRATEVLLGRLAGNGPAEREHTLPNLVIDRESVGPPPTMIAQLAQKGI